MRWIGVIAVAAVLAGCMVRYLRGSQPTGTCAGACAHYVGCRGGDRGDRGAVQAACLVECPEVFGDRDSLALFESLSCSATMDFVEGPAHRPPGSPPLAATASP